MPAIFDVTHKLHDENELVVRLTVGTERAKARKMGEAGDENIYGNRQSFAGTPELRKPQFTYGWDWVDAIPLGDKAHDEWIFVAYCEGDGVAADPCTWTLVPHRQLKLCEPKVNVTITGRTIELSSPVYCHGLRHHDAGKAMFSDNYFDLVPGVPKTIESVGDMPSQLKFEGLPARSAEPGSSAPMASFSILAMPTAVAKGVF